LIVDDNSDNGELLGKRLTLTGFCTDVVINGSLALKRIRDFKPHFIVIDLAMPDVSSCELANRVRQRPDVQVVSVIALSGYADREHVALALAAGCDYHLSKRQDMKAFNRIVDGEIEKRKPGLDGFFERA
jgi:CheY-like chemotaxis protein